MKKRTVYKIIDKHGNFYIGSTSQSLNARFSSHKYLNNRGIDFGSAKIFATHIDVQNFKEIEESLIKKELFSGNNKCKNKAWGCLGPSGAKITDRHRITSKKTMINLWSNPNKRKILLAGNKKGRDQNCHFEMSKKSHELRWSKMKKWTATEKETGKIFGPFQGYFFAKKDLSLHPDTIWKCLEKGRKNRKYIFSYIGDNL